MSDEKLRDRSFEWRASTDSGDGLTLEGYAAVFDQWTEIEDWEGRYLESLAKGAFQRTLRNRKDRVLLQYDHGHHPVLGSIPIGSIETLREDNHGLYVKARLHDNWMTQPVRDAVASGAVSGMSFRFKPIAERIEQPTKAKDLPKRTLTEVALFELGPVAWPAYEGTAVGLRAWADAAPLEFRSALLAQADAEDEEMAGAEPRDDELPSKITVNIDGAADKDAVIRWVHDGLRAYENSRRKPALVGESGPELVLPLAAGGFITPAGSSDATERGDTMTDESTTGSLTVADEAEPVPAHEVGSTRRRVTRQDQRQMALLLSGVTTNEPAGPAAAAAA